MLCVLGERWAQRRSGGRRRRGARRRGIALPDEEFASVRADMLGTRRTCDPATAEVRGSAYTHPLMVSSRLSPRITPPRTSPQARPAPQPPRERPERANVSEGRLYCLRLNSPSPPGVCGADWGR